MTYIDLTMRPNAAMAARQSWLVVAGVAAIMLLGAVRFVLLGAWPVAVFGVLDAGLLAWALNASAQASREMEEVRLDSQWLTVQHIAANGPAREWRLEPGLARIERTHISSREEALYLTARDCRVRIGAFLSVDEREELRQTIDAGLWRFRSAQR